MQHSILLFTYQSLYSGMPAAAKKNVAEYDHSFMPLNSGRVLYLLARGGPQSSHVESCNTSKEFSEESKAA
jgi:hypothetical protein